MKKVDPEILKLRDEHKQRVSDLKHKQHSAAILKTILTKRLPSLTMQDRQKLMDELEPNTTPSFPEVLCKPSDNFKAMLLLRQLFLHKDASGCTVESYLKTENSDLWQLCRDLLEMDSKPAQEPQETPADPPCQTC